MTMTAPTPTIQRNDLARARTNHAHPIDGVVESVAIAMLDWARQREARAAVSHEEHARRRSELAARNHREVQALRLAQHLGL